MRVIRITIRKILIITGTLFLLWKYHQAGNTVVISSTSSQSIKSTERPIREAGHHSSAGTPTIVGDVSQKKQDRTKEKFDISKLEYHMTLETLELKLRDKLGSQLPSRDYKNLDLKLNLVIPCRLDQTEERNIFRSVVKNFIDVENLSFRIVFKPYLQAN